MNEKDFVQLGISSALQKGLNSIGITVPTEIQQQTIPLILKGTDVIGRSETGSGKTFAYLLPLIQNIDLEDNGKSMANHPFKNTNYSNNTYTRISITSTKTNRTN